jgi:hypothetical protein
MLVFDIPQTVDIQAEAITAINRWQLDPARVRRALLIISYEYIHQVSFGFPPLYDVKSLSRKGTVHTVDPESHHSNCEDSTLGGNICQHRIAVYLYRQRLARTKETQCFPDLGF